MQLWCQPWINLLQPGAQQVGEQMVIAVPDALNIQGYQEEIDPVQIIKDEE
jgi:hypothetical protein